VFVQNKRTLLPLKKMEQIEIAFPFSLAMTDKEVNAVVRTLPYSTDPTRPDQTRPDPTRPDQTLSLVGCGRVSF